MCLYNSEHYTLAEDRELSQKERKNMAQEDFNYWFGCAHEFMLNFTHAFNRKSYNNAAFELHQVVEFLYGTVLLVFSRYKPNTHDLDKLRKCVSSQETQFLTIFPQGTLKERHCFELLCKAYVKARYCRGYIITEEELSWLGERTKKLQVLTEKLCKGKIASFIT